MLNRNLGHGIRNKYLHSQYVFFQDFTFLMIILLYPLEQGRVPVSTLSRGFFAVSMRYKAYPLRTLTRESQ